MSKRKRSILIFEKFQREALFKNIWFLISVNNIRFLLNYNSFNHILSIQTIEMNRFVFRLLGISVRSNWMTQLQRQTNQPCMWISKQTIMRRITRIQQEYEIKQNLHQIREIEEGYVSQEWTYFSKRDRWIFLLQGCSCCFVFRSQSFAMSTPVWIKERL